MKSGCRSTFKCPWIQIVSINRSILLYLNSVLKVLLLLFVLLSFILHSICTIWCTGLAATILVNCNWEFQFLISKFHCCYSGKPIPQIFSLNFIFSVFYFFWGMDIGREKKQGCDEKLQEQQQQRIEQAISSPFSAPAHAANCLLSKFL